MEKKSSKWQCKMCGERQSLKQVCQLVLDLRKRLSSFRCLLKVQEWSAGRLCRR